MSVLQCELCPDGMYVHHISPQLVTLSFCNQYVTILHRAQGPNLSHLLLIADSRMVLIILFLTPLQCSAAPSGHLEPSLIPYYSSAPLPVPTSRFVGSLSMNTLATSLCRNSDLLFIKYPSVRPSKCPNFTPTGF